MPRVEEVLKFTADDGKEHILGIDENSMLYWNNEPVITKKKVALQWWVNVSIIIYDRIGNARTLKRHY